MLSNCTFRTDRLLVKEWHSLAVDDWRPRDLSETVAAVPTEAVTRSLPDEWQGAYSLERALEWIDERDTEGTNLLAVDTASGEPAGLLILFGTQSPSNNGLDVRIGYLLAEEYWGLGLASELVSGFVGWCRGQGSISSISAGVGQENLASIKVLEKAGFHPVEVDTGPGSGELRYRLDL